MPRTHDAIRVRRWSGWEENDGAVKKTLLKAMKKAQKAVAPAAPKVTQAMKNAKKAVAPAAPKDMKAMK